MHFNQEIVNQSQRTIITNVPPSIKEYLLSIKKYQYFIWVLAVRDFKVRYIQTYLGWIWAILQPVITVSIFSFIFTNIVQLDTNGIPYILIALSGMVFWNYFSSIVSNGSHAIIASSELIKKVNFPKICLIISKVFLGKIEFIISYCLLFTAIFYFEKNPWWLTVSLPILVIYTVMIGLSVSIWIAALSIRYRDLLQLIPFVLSIGMWVSPVFYTTQNSENWISYLNFLNPMAGLIEIVRYIIFQTNPPSIYYLSGLILTCILFTTGLFYFKKIEKDIVPII